MGAEHLVAAVMVAGLVLYVLGGGADFGGGVWDLLASGPRKHAQRALVERAIGPIWEANHVWFIFVFVLLFAAFPPAFAAITTSLFGPLTIFAIGLVLRGSAFTFRHYAASAQQKRTMGSVFSAASVVCPFVLGSMGAMLVREGELRDDLDAFTLASGLFALSLVASLAATYLTVEAGDDEPLREDLRRRAIASLVVAGGASWLALITSRGPAPALFAEVAVEGAAAATSALGLVSLALLVKRRYRAARIAVGALASAVVLAWAASKGEVLAPPAFTLATAKAHPGTLRVLLVAVGLGSVILLPSLGLLFHAFGGPRQRRTDA